MASALRCGFISGRGLLGNLLSKAQLRCTAVSPCSAQKSWSEICLPTTTTHTRLQSIHTTSTTRSPLQEFFDEKTNWGEDAVKVGRPWRKDEFRIKSNTDLHKLWYVLLKERNMLMTMMAEYDREQELFPNPERFEKVEHSMENLLEVVAERNRAYNVLETGETGEPGRRWQVNVLGLGYWRRKREYYKPPHLGMKHYYNYERSWQVPFLRQLAEKKRRQRNWKAKKDEVYRSKMKEIFPHADID